MTLFEQQLQKMKTQPGFIAALDPCLRNNPMLNTTPCWMHPFRASLRRRTRKRAMTAVS